MENIIKEISEKLSKAKSNYKKSIKRVEELKPKIIKILNEEKKILNNQDKSNRMLFEVVNVLPTMTKGIIAMHNKMQDIFNMNNLKGLDKKSRFMYNET